MPACAPGCPCWDGRKRPTASWLCYLPHDPLIPGSVGMDIRNKNTLAKTILGRYMAFHDGRATSHENGWHSF